MTDRRYTRRAWVLTLVSAVSWAAGLYPVHLSQTGRECNTTCAALAATAIGVAMFTALGAILAIDSQRRSRP